MRNIMDMTVAEINEALADGSLSLLALLCAVREYGRQQAGV